nr:synaptonemal complex central element protein 3 [Nothobranchius furzeri]
MITDSPPDVQLSRSSDADMLELNTELERMADAVENQTVQVTWMAHDMVVLRTSPEVVDSMQELQEAYLRCKSAVYGEPESGAA